MWEASGESVGGSTKPGQLQFYIASIALLLLGGMKFHAACDANGASWWSGTAF
jgi:hypothetical protein